MNYEALIADARPFVPAKFSIDMCRHESVTLPTFWIFDGKSQIAAVAYEPNNAMPWRGTKMCRGMPSAQKRFLAMDHALAFVCAA